MARSIWSGAISFGLVNVPVKVYSAVSSKAVRFHMLHEKDGGRIVQKRVCSIDGEEVPWDEIARGYELRRGRYRMLTKDELEALQPDPSRSIEIEDFVDLAQIDPVFYDHTYYAAPDEGAERAYALLREAMTRTNKVAIARVVMRKKEYLCAIRSAGEALALSTMHYADEIVPTEELQIPSPPEVSGRELEMAKQLVESLASAFEPERYRDEHRARVLELLEKKEEGEEIVAPPEEERPRGVVVDLSEALERSLREAREERRGEDGKRERGERREREKAAARSGKRREES